MYLVYHTISLLCVCLSLSLYLVPPRTNFRNPTICSLLLYSLLLYSLLLYSLLLYSLLPRTNFRNPTICINALLSTYNALCHTMPYVNLHKCSSLYIQCPMSLSTTEQLIYKVKKFEFSIQKLSNLP